MGRHTKAASGRALTVLLTVAFLGAFPLVAQPVGPEFRVNTWTTSAQGYPSVATDASGNFVVVWQSRDQAGAGTYQVFGQRYSSAGARLGSEFRVSSSTVYQRYPKVASSSTGDFVVVWRTGGYAATFARRFSSTGVPLGDEFKVNPSGYAGHPGVAADAAGDFVVSWFSFTDIEAMRFSSTGAPLGGAFRVDDGTTDSLSMPAIAADASGDFVVVWLDNGRDGSANGVFGQRFGSDGAPRGAEFQVNVSTPGTQNQPAVALDSTGNFVVVWRDQQQDLLMARRFGSNGAPLTGEFRVDTGTFGGELPAVGSDGAGNVVVTWNDLDGGGLGIDGRLYESTGAPFGVPFLVNSYTTNGQLLPAVGVAPTGGTFVIAWISQGGLVSQDGSGDGIYARHFSSAAACRSGDVNWDGSIDVADVFYIINALFAGGPVPICPGDVNASGSVDVADVFYLINFLFAGGPAPAT